MKRVSIHKYYVVHSADSIHTGLERAGRVRQRYRLPPGCPRRSYIQIGRQLRRRFKRFVEVLGRSPARILTGDAARPFLFDVGDRVRFRRIDRAEFDRLAETRA